MPESISDGGSTVVVPHWYDVGQRPDPESSEVMDIPWVEYGAAGTSWHTIRESCVDKLTSAPVASLADVTWSLSKGITVLAISMYQWALSDDLAGQFSAFVVDAVETLGKGVWAALLGPVIILGALWMAWVWLVRRRATEVFQGALWMVGANVLSLLVIGSPSLVINSATDVTLAGSTLAHGVVGQIDASTGGIDQCPRASNTFSESDEHFGPVHPSQKEETLNPENAADWMWSSLVCRPWILGQFGSSEESKDIANDHSVELLYAQSISRTERHYIDEGGLTESELVEEKQAEFEAISAEIEERSPGVYAVHAGDRAGARLGQAAFSLAVSVTAGGLILALGFSILMLRIAFLILVLISPFVLLIGVHPGIGRRYLIRWLEVTIGVLIKEVFLTFALMLVAMLYVMVFASPLPWGGQMVVLAMIAIAVLWYRKRLVSIAGTTVNAVTPHRVIARVGGQQNEQPRTQASRGASGASGGGAGGSRALTRQGGADTGGRGRLRLRKRAGEQRGSGASGNTASSRAPAASGDAGTSGHGNANTSSGGGDPSQARASSGDRRVASGGDPGGSGRARSPRAAPALRRSDQSSSSGGSTEGTQPDKRSGQQRVSREEHQPRERGQTWGDVQNAQQGQQRRRDWGKRDGRG
ncbi:hypothetical protein F4561_005075 [Lipingzhangella halophila]|uniref:TrbL/VirB6 plasmid conjugal transfer protein n=1 Tax=Lipingzhangella halophila TaxID=1783352 RepID=A0A7W7RLL6_9ACTN|nr:hypothetical protein [Lipingzhangella halophila]MBB4934255.1 hypothetical protein [Lipingzhangella halophila]